MLALIVATVIPLLGWHWPSLSGLVQRILFAVAYLWYVNEALTLDKSSSPKKPQEPIA